MNPSLRITAACLASLVWACAAPSTQSTTSVSTEQSPRAALPTGTFLVIDARRASTVAAPAMPPPMTKQMPIGEYVTLSADTLEMRGIRCEDWQITRHRDTPAELLADPNLIDVTLGPSDSPKTSGDSRLNHYFKVSCEGELFASLLQIDEHVLIMPWANSAVNLVLERPLKHNQALQYQRQLKSMKFYDGPVTGRLDDATLAASRRWYEYRAQLPGDQPIPARPAITQNLLDALGVLAP